MTAVRVKDRDGSEQTLDAAETTPLMETLRDDGYGIEGTCGGAMSCGTCHVYVSEAWAARLPPPSEDEKAMLEAISDFAEVRPTSRLSCQILPDIIYDGLEVEIAPQA